MKQTENLPEKVFFCHKQTWYIGKAELADNVILVLIGPSGGVRWTQEGHRTKRRSLFANVRIISNCDQDNADRVEMLLDLADKLLEKVSCMKVAGDIEGEPYAAYNEAAEFDPTSDPLDYDRLANNMFFTSFSLEFFDQQLFVRE